MNEEIILVTGGSGFLGINLIRFLMKNTNFKIRVIDFAPFEYPELDKIEFFLDDIRDVLAVQRAMKGVSYVVHCAAALPLYKKEDILTTDIDGTRNLLEAAKEQNVKRFVHISSTAVYGIPDHHPLLETDELLGVGTYGEAKISAEEVCLGFREQGMTISIIRPKSFIGPERLGVFSIFYEWATEGRNFPIIGRGTPLYQFLDVEDLCNAIYICLTKEKEAVNDVFNIGAKVFRSMKEDYQAVLDYAGHGKKIKAFPAWMVVWPLRILEFLHLSPLYKWVYETMGKESFVSIEKAEQVLGFKPVYSNEDALIRNYKWYLENIDNINKQTGVSHRVPWKQGILKLVKYFF